MLTFGLAARYGALATQGRDERQESRRMLGDKERDMEEAKNTGQDGRQGFREGPGATRGRARQGGGEQRGGRRAPCLVRDRALSTSLRNAQCSPLAHRSPPPFFPFPSPFLSPPPLSLFSFFFFLPLLSYTTTSTLHSHS